MDMETQVDTDNYNYDHDYDPDAEYRSNSRDNDNSIVIAFDEKASSTTLIEKTRDLVNLAQQVRRLLPGRKMPAPLPIGTHVLEDVFFAIISKFILLCGIFLQFYLHQTIFLNTLGKRKHNGNKK